jgi:hypothetical protein
VLVWRAVSSQVESVSCAHQCDRCHPCTQLSSLYPSLNVQVSAVDGVLECTDEHYWTQSPGVVVGSLHVRVRSNADEQAILSTVHRIFGKFITHLTVQVDKDPPLDWILPG